jgi:ribosome-binding protein aMBF1 (putative translation factor)
MYFFGGGLRHGLDLLETERNQMTSNIKVREETDREKAARLGNAIRTARREFGCSLGTIARAVGVRTSYLSSIERGKIPLNEIESMFCGIMRSVTCRWIKD